MRESKIIAIIQSILNAVVVANMIKNRKSYRETYPPISIRKKQTRVKTKPNNSVEILETLQTGLMKKLDKLGIKKYDLVDDYMKEFNYVLPKHKI